MTESLSFRFRYTSPGVIKSTSNKLWVKFASDGTVNKGGFQASFSKVFDECAARKNPCDHVCVNVDGENSKKTCCVFIYVICHSLSLMCFMRAHHLSPALRCEYMYVNSKNFRNKYCGGTVEGTSSSSLTESLILMSYLTLTSYLEKKTRDRQTDLLKSFPFLSEMVWGFLLILCLFNTR